MAADRGHRVFAALYDRLTAPAERAVLAPRRAALLASLGGTVVDVGAGTGANLPHYRAAARVVAAEPDPAMRRRLDARATTAAVPVEVVPAGAERLPLADSSADAVVCTLVLCTVADPAGALAEAGRVLRPGGRLVVLEHVRGDERAATWQRRVDPVWSRLFAGCHVDRDTEATVLAAGFAPDAVERFTVGASWFPTSPMLQLTATRPG